MPRMRIWTALAVAGMLFIPDMPATDAQAIPMRSSASCDRSPACRRSYHRIYDFERARRNYLAIARGSKSLNDLHPIEAQEVLALIELMHRNRADHRSAYERCRDRQLAGKTAPSELELSLIDLKCSMQ